MYSIAYYKETMYVIDTYCKHKKNWLHIYYLCIMCKVDSTFFLEGEKFYYNFMCDAKVKFVPHVMHTDNIKHGF